MQGLTEQEVILRRKQGLGNNIDLTPSRTYAQIVQKNVFTFVNLVLFTIALLLVVFGSPADAITTAGLVFMNVMVGLVQEARAKRKLDQIALLSRPKVTVIRDGQEQEVDPSEIVVGDWIIVRPGDQIVCDGEIVGNGHLEVDESLLTGEADYISKREGDAVYSGSFCISGRAVFEARRVGRESLANTITAKARRFEILLTPLQVDVNKVVRVVSLVCTVLGIVLITNAGADNLPTVERVQIAAVIMGTIPQGLIFLVTLSYALGAVRLSRRGILTQQNNAIESLSHTTVLCLDKTGTLTTNEISVQKIITSGPNNIPLGRFAASSSNRNRTTEAIHQHFQDSAIPATEEVEFTSSRKWSGITFSENSTKGIYVLGAPEVIAPNLRETSPEWYQQIQEWSAYGLRTVLFTTDPDGGSLFNREYKPELPSNLTPLALIALKDELRPDTQTTLEAFRDAGVQIKIISGDNPQAVAALATQVGFDTSGGIVSGAELASMDSEAFAKTATTASVFGRVTPDQKEQLIETMKASETYVAMIGDGVNDVLALKKAHIGIAMQNGSAATRNVADLVLLDNRFSALPEAFSEGQRIVNGIQDTMRLLLTRTSYVLMIICCSFVLGLSFPFLPTQDALNSFITAGLPPLLLAIWAKPGQAPHSILSKVWQFVLPAAMTITFAGTVVYVIFLDSDSLDIARSALLTAVILCGCMLVLFVQPPIPFFSAISPQVKDKRPAWMSIGLIALYTGIVLLPPAREFFVVELLRLADYLLIVGAVAVWIFVVRAVFAWRA